MKNHELRVFLNSHEKLIEKVMDTITDEINQDKCIDP
jgi:hypothetical protein